VLSPATIHYRSRTWARACVTLVHKEVPLEQKGIFPIHYSHLRKLIREQRPKRSGQRGDVVHRVVSIIREIEDPNDVEAPDWDANRVWLNKRAKAATVEDTSWENAARIYSVIHGHPPADNRQLTSLLPAHVRLEVFETCDGDADKGQIQIIEEGENLVEGHPIASGYVGIKVDKVKFWRKWGDNDEPIACHGEYFRIFTPNRPEGAAGLVVGVREGRVYLTTEFRHACRDYRTECPRGYGDVGDTSTDATLVREVREELGFGPYQYSQGRDEIMFLGDSYPDTGKLRDCPALYAMLVDDTARDPELRRDGTIMQDPCWVKFDVFYSAIFSTTSLTDLVEGRDFGFLRDHPGRERMRCETAISRGELDLKCGFTTQAALLALPFLKKRLCDDTGVLPPEAFNIHRYWSRILV